MRIALLNFGGLGDEILFSPVIAAIRHAYPQAHLTLVLEHRSRAVADLIPGLDAVETVTQIHNRKVLFWQLLTLLRRGRFNTVISSGSSPFIAVLLWASGIGQRVGYASGKLTDRLLTHAAGLNTQQYAGNMYASLAEAYLHKPLPNPALPVLCPSNASLTTDLLTWFKTTVPASQRVVMIHPGVSLLSVEKRILKSWSVANWFALITQLLQADCHVVLAGGPDDTQTLQQLTQQVQALDAPLKTRLHIAAGQTRNLHDLAWLLQQVNVLVCVDSAPMHLAIAVNTPVVAMFGPTDPDKLIPPGNARFQAITVNPLPCRPCLFDTRKTSCDTPVCLDVTVDAIYKAVTTALATQTQQ